MTEFSNLCMYCMSDMQGKDVCPVCGHRKGEPQIAGALPYGTTLQKRYSVGRALRSNGEGFTYIGIDNVLNIRVEIHEFYPASIAERKEDGKSVRILGGSELPFQENLTEFLRYSREIAHMRELSAIIQIYDIFEENGVAYTVSEWNDSITLRYFVKRSGGHVSWNVARQLFMPVLSALKELHAHSILHLGISPDTLMIMRDGKMKLGGFSIAAVRQMDTDLPPDLAPGCAAIEQYVMGDKPSEATDVYGFAASLFFALTGQLPPEAPRRRTDARLLIPNSIMHSLPPYVVSAIANALQVVPEKRTQSFERLREEITAAPSVAAALESSQRFDRIAAVEPRNSEKAEKEKPEKKEVSGFVWVISSCLVMLVIFVAIAIVWMNNKGIQSRVAQASVSSAVSQESSQIVSSNAESAIDQITVPNLVGKDYNELVAAQSAADSDQDYNIAETSTEFSDTIEEGKIISQDPKPGTKMQRGSTIVVVVSQGAAVRTLPAITGKALNEASALVTSAGFVPIQGSEYSDKIPKGLVIGYKDVKAGSQMAYGSTVTILVSLGPKPASQIQ
jgi:eukaryotic-like serine/threonine-protein kinase